MSSTEMKLHLELPTH